MMFLKIVNTSYKVDVLKNQILDDENSVVHPNNGMYNIRIKNVNVCNTFDWFFKLSVFNLDLPQGYENWYKELEFVKTQNVIKSNVEFNYLPVFKRNIDIVFRNEVYRVIPRFPRYCISKSGDLKILSSMVSVRPFVGGNRDYVYFSLMDSMLTTKKVTVSQHRLVAYCWIDNDDYYNKFIVNHIDMNKRNNNVSNLEWVSPRENIVKANDKSSLDVYFCRRIGDITVYGFPSIAKCCEFMGRSKIDINMTPLKKGKIWKCKNGDFYVSDNKKELSIRCEDGIKFEPTIRKIKIAAMNIYSGEVLRFNSVLEASRELGLGRSAITSRVFGKLRDRHSKGWIIKVDDGDNSFPDAKGVDNLPVQCLCVDEFGHKRIFKSKKELGKFLGTTNHIINNCIENKRQFERNGIKYTITVHLTSDS